MKNRAFFIFSTFVFLLFTSVVQSAESDPASANLVKTIWNISPLGGNPLRIEISPRGPLSDEECLEIRENEAITLAVFHSIKTKIQEASSDLTNTKSKTPAISLLYSPHDIHTYKEWSERALSKSLQRTSDMMVLRHIISADLKHITSLESFIKLKTQEMLGPQNFGALTETYLTTRDAYESYRSDSMNFYLACNCDHLECPNNIKPRYFWSSKANHRFAHLLPSLWSKYLTTLEQILQIPARNQHIPYQGEEALSFQWVDEQFQPIPKHKSRNLLQALAREIREHDPDYFRSSLSRADLDTQREVPTAAARSREAFDDPEYEKQRELPTPKGVGFQGSARNDFLASPCSRFSGSAL